MSICAGCGMVLGRDCFNEFDCVHIQQDMALHARVDDFQSQPHWRELLSTWPAILVFSLGLTWLVVRYVPRLLTFIWSV